MCFENSFLCFKFVKSKIHIVIGRDEHIGSGHPEMRMAMTSFQQHGVPYDH